MDKNLKTAQYYSDKGGTAFSLSAANATQSGNSIHLRSVEIVSGAVIIRANSADFESATGQIETHGKVTITLQKTAGGGGVPPSLMKEILPSSMR